MMPRCAAAHRAARPNPVMGGGSGAATPPPIAPDSG